METSDARKRREEREAKAQAEVVEPEAEKWNFEEISLPTASEIRRYFK